MIDKGSNEKEASWKQVSNEHFDSIPRRDCVILTLSLSIGPGDLNGLALHDGGGGVDHGGRNGRGGREGGGSKDSELEHGEERNGIVLDEMVEQKVEASKGSFEKTTLLHSAVRYFGYAQVLQEVKVCSPGSSLCHG